MPAPLHRSPRALTAVAALSCTLLATGCTSQAPQTPSPSLSATTTAPEDEMRYRDGDYQAEGWYGGLPSHITVDLSLQDDAITDVSITNHATDPTSLGYQEAFAEAIGEIAIGQPLDDADVDIVAGASGTSEGWNSALDLIREEARS
ncbi:MAG: hypothetical protein DI611_14555 [Brachybacterium faecium]|nr:MAG: hypothetical protein DI611_14555 [Brachybacterium faecium]